MGRSIVLVRDIGVDYKFGSYIAQALINKVMLDGKKSLATKIVHDAMDMLEGDAKEKLEQAVENLKPELEVRYRKIGGSTCAVPRTPNGRKALFLALNWLVDAARKNRKSKTMSQSLADEINLSYQKSGFAIEQREQLHKLAESNRAYSGLNW